MRGRNIIGGKFIKKVITHLPCGKFRAEFMLSGKLPDVALAANKLNSELRAKLLYEKHIALGLFAAQLMVKMCRENVNAVFTFKFQHNAEQRH